MDPLNDLTSEALRLASLASNAFWVGHPKLAYKYLGILYDFLDDEVGSGARDKCESAESSSITEDRPSSAT